MGQKQPLQRPLPPSPPSSGGSSRHNRDRRRRGRGGGGSPGGGHGGGGSPGGGSRPPSGGSGGSRGNGRGRRRMSQDRLRCQMDLLAQDARQRSHGRQIRNITHCNTVTTVYEDRRRLGSITHKKAKGVSPRCIMPKIQRQRCLARARQGGGKRRRQDGGILPSLALAIPGLIAAGNAATLGGVGAAAAAEYGVKKGLEAATRRRRR